MTRAMRAVRPAPGTVALASERQRHSLRLAVVRDGVITFEQRFEGRHVHIGTDLESDVLVDGGPAKHRLFEFRAGRFTLAPYPGLTAKMSGDVAQKALDMDERGMLAIGTARLLFHVVPSMPKAAPQPLPAAFDGGVLGTVDWFTTVVAAFSFLLHFFAVALVYSDWLDPVVDDNSVMARLVENSKRVHVPPPLSQPATAAAEAATAAPKESGTSAKSTDAVKGRDGGGNTSGRSPLPRESGANDRAAALGAELDALGIQTLSALDATGPATGIVMDDGNVPLRNLEEAAASQAGVEEADGLKISDGEHASNFVPGENNGPGPTQTRRRDDTEIEGETKKVDGPKFQGGTSGGDVSPGSKNIPGAAAVIARMRGPFRGCYRGGLSQNPTLQGSTSLVASIAANGSVTSVAGGGGALAPIAGCLKAIVRGAQFTAPRDGRGVVSISVNFLLTE